MGERVERGGSAQRTLLSVNEHVKTNARGAGVRRVVITCIAPPQYEFTLSPQLYLTSSLPPGLSKDRL